MLLPEPVVGLLLAGRSRIWDPHKKYSLVPHMKYSLVPHMKYSLGPHMKYSLDPPRKYSLDSHKICS